LEYLRAVLQETHLVYPNSWYDAQGFGYRTETPGDWCGWRKPDSTELKASVILALSHGVKGIMFWQLGSRRTGNNSSCNTLEREYIDCIIDEDLQPSELFYVIKNNIAPRLKSTLGTTLLSLNYTGDFINIQYEEQLPESFDNEEDFLTIHPSGMSYYWHAGFLNQVDNPDNKYFLLTNLRTTFQNVAVIDIENNTDFVNLGIRDVENHTNSINTTISTTQSFSIQIPAGDGYLFQVAPVLKYGGRLIYNETVIDGTILFEDMSIENGATLTINGTYNAKANITVKSGGKIMYGENSIIIFDPGKKLIVEGSTEIKGTSASNKLTLQFSGNDNAVLVKPGSSLTMDYCNITGAYQGIVTETGSRSYVNISNTNISAVY